MEPVFLRVADITIGLVGRPGGPPLAVTEAATPFLVASGPADVMVETDWGDLAGPAAGTVVFDAGATWQLRREADRLTFRFHSAAHGDIPYRTAVFDASLTRGEVRLHRPYFDGRPAVYPLAFPLDELLTITLLGQGRGVEVHACGVVDRSGAGYLFVGQSGAGKSTMATLWLGAKGVTILSDDRVVLRRVGGRVRMYGTPWHGDAPLASPRSVPLSHVFFLRQAPRPACSPVTEADAVAALVAASFVPFHSAAALEFTLGLLERVVADVPSATLDFAPEPTVIDLVRRLTR